MLPKVILLLMLVQIGDYQAAYDRAALRGKPLVVGVACAAPAGEWELSLVKRLDGYQAPCIVLSVPKDGWLYWKATLPPTATAKDIRASLGTVRLEVRPISAAPFSGVAPRATADGDERTAGPWLSSAEHQRIRSLWPVGVPWGQRLKFYTLAPRYQNLYTMNNGTFHGRNIDPLHHEQRTFTVSGGMTDVDASTWNSVKGLDIPAGKTIDVWEEYVDVLAYADVPRYRWSFPEGARAYDVLFNGTGDIFEIRTRTKTEDGWLPEIVHRDKEAAPVGFRGASDCTACHSHTAEVVNVPGRIYRRVRWGDDSVWSWRPFGDDGLLDTRWPLRKK